MKRNPDEISIVVEEVVSAGLKCVVYMAMGRSSLPALVFAKAFVLSAPGLPLIVLDTTDPATVLSIRETVLLEQTLFIVASKSGTTAEPQTFDDSFFQEMGSVKGGRYSALTYFGLVLAALMGIDLSRLFPSASDRRGN